MEARQSVSLPEKRKLYREYILSHHEPINLYFPDYISYILNVCFIQNYSVVLQKNIQNFSMVSRKVSNNKQFTIEKEKEQQQITTFLGGNLDIKNQIR